MSVVDQTFRLLFVLHVLADHNTDIPALQDDDCNVHSAKCVCDLFKKYDGILRYFGSMTVHLKIVEFLEFNFDVSNKPTLRSDAQ